MKKIFKLTKQLTSVNSPSGYEEGIREEIKKVLKKTGIKKFEVNKLGSLIVKIGTGKKKVMLAAHMDEIGILATHIDKNGFIRFGKVGGVHPYGLMGSRVKFMNGSIGIISSEPISSKDKPEISKMYIDVGAANKKEAEKLVPIGTFGVFDRTCEKVGNRLVSKAMDDRIGCVVLIEVIEKILKLKKLPYQVYFVFTVQEEVGLRGARTAAFQLEPDIGIAVDVTGTGDCPESRKMSVSLGEGTAIKVKDRSVITHPKLKDFLVKTAVENKIKYQMEILEYGGTDAGAIHLTRAGIPSGVLSIPTRYIHSQSEMIDLRDVLSTRDLLVRVLSTPDLGKLKF